MYLFPRHCRPDQDLTLLRKLDGVADEIGQDLTRAFGITDQRRRYLRGNLADQLQSFFIGIACECFHGPLKLELERKLHGNPRDVVPGFEEMPVEEETGNHGEPISMVCDHSCRQGAEGCKQVHALSVQFREQLGRVLLFTVKLDHLVLDPKAFGGKSGQKSLQAVFVRRPGVAEKDDEVGGRILSGKPCPASGNKPGEQTGDDEKNSG